MQCTKADGWRRVQGLLDGPSASPRAWALACPHVPPPATAASSRPCPPSRSGDRSHTETCRKGRLRPTPDAINLTRNFSGPPAHVTHVHSLANRFVALIYSFGNCLWVPLPSLATPGRWDGQGRDLGRRRQLFCSPKPPPEPWGS